MTTYGFNPDVAAPLIKAKTSKDDRIMTAFMLVIGLYLICDPGVSVIRHALEVFFNLLLSI